MASEVTTIPTLTLTPTAGDAPPGATDPVVRTALDRRGVCAPPPPGDPTADHADATLSARRADVEEKHRRVVQFLDANGVDALLLTRADSLAWFTSGGEFGEGLAGDSGAVAIFVNRLSRAVLADNVQSPRVFEEEVAGLGFQLKERPWQDDAGRVLDELTYGRKVVADAPNRRFPDEMDRLRALRLALTRLERRRLRELGRALTLAIEATCRALHPGDTEADVAGQLAHRLFREGITPMEIRIAADDRPDRFRQPGLKAAPIRSRAVVAATGRRQGLCASATRIVSFGPVPDAFRKCQGLAAMVDATCIYFSRPGETVADAFRRARRIYAKYGHPEEWTLDYQGFLTGYSPREVPLKPDSSRVLDFDTAIRWGPSVGGARSEDTVVVDARGFEVVTEVQNWPSVEVLVKGFALPRPGILER